METKKKFPTQKGQNVLNLTEDQARQHIEKLLWPDGQPVCRNCGSVNCYRMEGKSCRPGLCRCRDCEKQFTVTVGTIFEDSHLPLTVWVRAIHLMSTSKKGISALQLQRNLGLGSYKTAWHLAHRIRLAMQCTPMPKLLKGDVQVDETYVGSSRSGRYLAPGEKPVKRGRGTSKIPVLALVETGGHLHSQPIERVDGATIKAAMQNRVDPSARLVADELRVYPKVAADYAGHSTVNHAAGQYVNDEGLTTNEAEAYFALLKRGIHGTFHHVSKQHLHRYCDEFSFRWNGRKLQDTTRRDAAVCGAEGKRLMFKMPAAQPPMA
jgi:transposase-like protein